MKILMMMAIGCLSLGACRKCETCSYSGTNQVTNQDVSFTYNEECSKSMKRVNREDCEAAAQFYNGQCSCTDS